MNGTDYLNIPALDGYIPDANSVPQDPNPSATDASLTSGGGTNWTDTFTKLLGTALNYNLQKDALANQASINAHAATVQSPLTAGLIQTPSGGINVVGVLLVVGVVVGIGYAAHKLLK